MTPELYARIRRLFFGEHWKVGTIAKELGIHHDTVRSVLETERMCPRPSPTRPSILDPYKSFILDTLAQHPTLRASRIYDMIRTRGYVGSAVQVRRYVRTVRPARSHEPFIVRQTLPGEEAQVDWGHFGKITVGHAQRALSCFVMVLGHSRAMHACFTLDQTLESFIRGHVASFERFGGVARKVLYDNLKSVVIERQGEHIRFHETILELAGHYHFAPTPCAHGTALARAHRALGRGCASGRAASTASALSVFKGSRHSRRHAGGTAQRVPARQAAPLLGPRKAQ